MTPEEKLDWTFQFTVQDFTKAQAQALMDLVQATVERYDASVGGGFWQETHDEIEEEDDG